MVPVGALDSRKKWEEWRVAVPRKEEIVCVWESFEERGSCGSRSALLLPLQASLFSRGKKARAPGKCRNGIDLFLSVASGATRKNSGRGKRQSRAVSEGDVAGCRARPGCGWWGGVFCEEPPPPDSVQREREVSR